MQQEDQSALQRWQDRLLSFMAVSLVALAVFFFGASLWHYGELQQHFSPPPLDLRQELKQLDARPNLDAGYRDWYTRVLLEEFALKRRYQQNSIALQSRIWTRLIGFLTGMVLVFSGCVFILGKLRESVNLGADLPGAKWTLITSSPGLALAVCGTAVIALSIYIPAKVDSTDAAVYLMPSSASEAGHTQLPSPPPMSPPETVLNATPSAQSARKQPTQPVLPSDVQQLLGEEAAKKSEPKFK